MASWMLSIILTQLTSNLACYKSVVWVWWKFLRATICMLKTSHLDKGSFREISSFKVDLIFIYVRWIFNRQLSSAVSKRWYLYSEDIVLHAFSVLALLKIHILTCLTVQSFATSIEEISYPCFLLWVGRKNCGRIDWNDGERNNFDFGIRSHERFVWTLRDR